jgi:hypothetical protein
MKIAKLLLPLAAVVFATTSHAQLINMQAEWSGGPLGNGASAVATFTLDTSQLNNPGFSSFSGPTFLSTFQSFQITVSGASSGNGVFTTSDFSAIFLNTSGGTLDFNSELMGQSTPSGAWGTGAYPTNVGDFNLFSSGVNPLTPNGSSIFTLISGGAEQMLLTSFAPIPEPSSWMMGCLALGVNLLIRRRNSVRA